MEEELHMALCIVKVFALVVIASSLVSISNSLGNGYARNGPSAWSGQGVWVPGPPQSLDLTASAAGYNVEFSQPNQGTFSNRHEPPVFWNIGELSEYEKAQVAEARSAFAAIKNQPAAQSNVGYAFNPDYGYAFNPDYGYATDKLIQDLY